MVQVRKKLKDSGFVIDRRYHRILEEAFYKLYILTPDQVCRLLYKAGGGSLRGVETSLKKLFEDGYLHRFPLPTGKGESPLVYTMTKKSRDYLMRCGAASEDIYYIPYGDEEKNYGVLMHLLELNDFLIIALLAEKHTQNVRLFDFQHDIYLKTKPLIVWTSDKDCFEVVPDAFLYFKIKTKEEREITLGVWLELDRGNHSVTAFKRKFNHIRVAGQKGVIYETFGVDRICFAFVTPTGDDRVEKMRVWTRQELLGKDRKKVVSPYGRNNMKFKFLAVPTLKEWNNINVADNLVDRYTVRNILIGDMWSVAFTGDDDGMRVRLLDGGGSDNVGEAGAEYE